MSTKEFLEKIFSKPEASLRVCLSTPIWIGGEHITSPDSEPSLFSPLLEEEIQILREEQEMLEKIWTLPLPEQRPSLKELNACRGYIETKLIRLADRLYYLRSRWPRYRFDINIGLGGPFYIKNGILQPDTNTRANILLSYQDRPKFLLLFLRNIEIVEELLKELETRLEQAFFDEKSQEALQELLREITAEELGT